MITAWAARDGQSTGCKNFTCCKGETMSKQKSLWGILIVILMASFSITSIVQTANIDLHSAHAVPQIAWELHQSDPDMARRGTAAAFDHNRQVVVMFGGEHNGPVYNETWEFDGIDWQQVTTNQAPPARFWHGLAYDSERQVVVLFGGYDDQNFLSFNDTWEYNGQEWQQVTTAQAPSARYGFGMTYDSCRQKTILFSGSETTGTWEYDGQNWQEIDTAVSPVVRNLTAMVFDSNRCRAVLFGGGQWGLGLNDTWEYDGNNWIQIATANVPLARWAHALAYDPIRQKTILFGGYGPEYPMGTLLDDTWEFDGTDWLETSPLESPSAREQHMMVYDGNTQNVLLFGGFGNGETWLYGQAFDNYFVFLPIVVR
jgi:hypothetical protein